MFNPHIFAYLGLYPPKRLKSDFLRLTHAGLVEVSLPAAAFIRLACPVTALLQQPQSKEVRLQLTREGQLRVGIAIGRLRWNMCPCFGHELP